MGRPTTRATCERPRRDRAHTVGPARENERIVRRYGGGTGKRGDGRPDVHALTEVLSFGFLLAQSGHDWGGGPPWAGGGGNFWGPWMLVPFFFWAGLVALVAWIVTRLFPRRHGGSGGGGPDPGPAGGNPRERLAPGGRQDEG